MSGKLKYRAWDGKKLHYNIMPWRWDFCIDLMWHKCIENTGNSLSGIGGSTGKFEVGGIRIVEGSEQQYTGLKNKDGMEIYEGDILMMQDGTRNPYVVKWSDNFCGFGIDGTPSGLMVMLIEYIKDMQIIGNIYENPELLTNGN